MEPIRVPSAIAAMCMECAESIYIDTPPTEEYATAVGTLLVCTGAQESAFMYRRQIGFGYHQLGGAWGLWQTEFAPSNDSWLWMKQRKDLYDRAMKWLFHDSGVGDGRRILNLVDQEEWLFSIATNDRFACLLVRLHYLRMPGLIPLNAEGQAAYWKRFYNTHLGKGTEAQYLERCANLEFDE